MPPRPRSSWGSWRSPWRAWPSASATAPRPRRRQPSPEGSGGLSAPPSLGTAVVLAVTLVGQEPLHAVGVHFPPFGFFLAILALILARIAVGVVQARRDKRGHLDDREVRWVFLFVLALFFVLSLGSVIFYQGGRSTGASTSSIPT